MMSSLRLTRRRFLRSTTVTSAGILTAILGAGALRMLWPNQHSPEPGTFGTVVTVAREDLPPVNGTPYLSEAGHFYVTNTDEGLTALFWLCTRPQRCTIAWDPHDHGGRLRCPCCGASFDLHGTRLSGPAPRPLDIMRLTLDDDGNARVDTRVIIQRGGERRNVPGDPTPLPAV
jgi:cytochrome b6-f complex iron-sulfur subunit